MRPVQQTKSGALRSIPLSDGQPILGDVVAAVDESARELDDGAWCYIVAAVVIRDWRTVQEAARAVTRGRKVGYHHHKEGVQAKERMAAALKESGAHGTALWQMTHTTGQVDARRALLSEQARRLPLAGVEHLLIESGDRTSDQRDSETLLDAFASHGRAPFRYDWRSKHEPLLWLADAVAGFAAERLTGSKPSGLFDGLAAVGIITVERL